MRIGITLLTAAAVLASAFVVYAGEQTRFGAAVTEWNVGDGQVNENFVTGERYGVQVALRAQRRFSATPLTMTRDKDTAEYSADTGTSDGGGRATWNYDFHIDLRGAQGVAAGKTLGDYDAKLDTDIGSTLYGLPVPFDLGLLAPSSAVLLQDSWNPKFGNAGFDATAEGTYNFTLTLTPKTFHGPAIEAKMRVVVTNP